MLISEKIKEMRKKEGYTQEQLANELSVSRSTITNWETGKSVPDDNKIKAIADLFNISIDDLTNEDTDIENAVADSDTTQNQKAEEENEKEEAEEAANAEELTAIKDSENIEKDTTEEKNIEENNDAIKSNFIKDKLFSKINLRNKKVIIALSSSVLAIILLIIVITEVVPFIGKCIDMSKAEKLMNSGDYISASKIYLSINSEDAQEKYNECIYAYANSLHNTGDYENAISQIDSITYKDSSELSKAWNYEYALYNIKTGNYKKAIELFESLESYNGSEFKAKELSHYYGTKLYNEKNFKDAATYLGKFSKDAPLYNNALYNYAIELHNNGNLAQAYNIFQDLAKIPYEKSVEMAIGILKFIFVQCDNSWRYKPIAGSDKSIQFTFMDNALYKHKCFLNFGKADKLIEYFLFDFYIFTPEELGIQDATKPIVFMCINTKNPKEVIFLTFNFTNNSKVYIHPHYSDDKCSSLCGSYTAERELDLSSYTTKYKFDFKKTKLPQLSFASEVQNIPTSTVNTNIQNPETSNIATELEQNTAQISPELNTTSVNSESNVYNQNYISNNDTSKSSNEDFYNPSNYAQNQNSAINSSNNTQKPNVTSNPCANGHSWKDATCTSPATCSICGKTSGSPLEHSYRPATCTSPKMCKYCKTTVGTVAPHNMYYTKCQNCDYTDFSEYTLTSNTFCLDSWYYLDSKTHYLEDGEASINIDSNGVCKVTFDKYSYTFTLVQSDVDAYGLHFKCYMNGEYLKNAEVTFFFEQNRCDFFVYGGTLGFSQVSLNFDM